MTTVDLKVELQRLYDEVVTEGNLDLIDEVFHEDFVEHEEFPGLPPGREGPRAFITMMRDAFPDLSATIDDIIVEGDKVVTRVRFSGTHQGEFQGIPATGRKIDIQTIDILAYRDGKISEHWGVTDQLAMMQQLGVIEEPA
ncbi:MAG: ester cyclase [Acidimicrobiia bacterium]